MSASLDDIIANFDLLDEWDDRYRYLIELGKKLPQLDETEMADEHRVHGCQASVWLRMLPQTNGTFDIHADSDAFIVRGLIAVLLMIYNGKNAKQILDTDSTATFAQLGLDKHLSPTRRNGLHSMVSRVRALASNSIVQTT